MRSVSPTSILLDRRLPALLANLEKSPIVSLLQAGPSSLMLNTLPASVCFQQKSSLGSKLPGVFPGSGVGAELNVVLRDRVGAELEDLVAVVVTCGEVKRRDRDV